MALIPVHQVKILVITDFPPINIHVFMKSLFQVSPSLLPNYLLKYSAGHSSTSIETSSSSVESISASVTRRQEEEEEEMGRCKGRAREPNTSSDEEDEETDDDEEESDEEELDSSGDESPVWTWSGCSSRSRLLKSQHSDCRCSSCNVPSCKSFLSSHSETRHRLGDLCVTGAKACTGSCGGKGAEPVTGDVPCHNPIEGSGIFDTTFCK